jgi:REP element-mobilizing transposase RayT
MRRAFYRRHLPHLQRDYRPHFITFCTHKKWILPEFVRKIVLDCCVHDHDRTINLYVSLVRPDHVHMIFTPLVNHQAREIYSLASIMDAIKGASAHQINRALGRKGSVWQAESFDHVHALVRKPRCKDRLHCGEPGAGEAGHYMARLPMALA